METTYNPENIETNIRIAADILMNGRWADYGKRTCEPRLWHRREQEKYPMHSAVTKAIKLARPDNWQKLLLEWPHVPTELDPANKARVAYTQSVDKGERDLQTVTSLGKYLKSHFALLPDHAIRDLVASASTSGMKFVHTTAEMLYHLHRGPGSCMVWGDNDPDNHPYRTYDPKYGWHLCVHTDGDDTIGRALCCVDGSEKFYVRTYRKTSGSSSRDENMEAWLAEQGYVHRDGWDGCLLSFLPGIRGSEFLAPYLDGNEKHVDTTRIDGKQALRITDDGEYECCNTNGTPDERNALTCDSCSDRMSEDDGYWIGRNADVQVCEYCRDEYYCYAYGRNRDQYYVHQDDTVYVESQGEHYHDSYLGDNGIICLENGEYEHVDNAVEIDGDWYHTDDDDIVRLESGDYAMRDNAYECADDGKWYSRDDEPPVEVDGETYHPDNAPDSEEATEPTE